MEDLAIAVAAGIGELLLWLLYPLRFVLSPAYRRKVIARWRTQPRWLVVFNQATFVFLYLACAVVVFAGLALLGR